MGHGHGRTTRHRARAGGAALCAAGALIGAAGVAPALAVHPRPAGRYSGSGRLCENNAPHHRFSDCVGRDGFAFHTSADGSRVTGFAGNIGPLYCGGGTPTITARFISVAGDGSFRYTFSVPERGPTGKVTGRVQIEGRFTGSGRTATIFYRLVSHTRGTPGSQDCGAQVNGTAHAH